MNQSNHFSSTSNRYKDKVYLCVKSLMKRKPHGMIWRGKGRGEMLWLCYDLKNGQRRTYHVFHERKWILGQEKADRHRKKTDTSWSHLCADPETSGVTEIESRMEDVKGWEESGMMRGGVRWVDGFHTAVKQGLSHAASSAVYHILQKPEEKIL